MFINPYLDYETILANTHQPIHFALKFKADEIDSKRERPLAFCVVLDRSGSMYGEPLKRAKEASALVVRNLREEDQFALITFDTEANTVFPLQVVKDKAALIRTIETIQPGRTTNLTGGWMLGRDELKKAGAGITRRLLLLSDGLLNCGVTEPDQVSSVVCSGLEMDKIRTSTLGFGEGYDEDLLSDLANRTSGQFYDANNADKLPAIFESELDGLQKISAQNIRVRIKSLDFCDNLQALAELPKVTLPDGRIEFALGDLVSGEEQVVCWEMDGLPIPMVEGQPVVSLEGEGLLDVEVLYDEIREEGIASETFHQVILVKATQDPAEVKPNGEVVSWTSMQRTGKTMSKAIKLMDQRDMDGALKLLTTSIEQLQSMENIEGLEDAIEPLLRLKQTIEGGLYNRVTRKSTGYESRDYRYMKSDSAWSASTPAPRYKRDSARLKPKTDQQQ